MTIDKKLDLYKNIWDSDDNDCEVKNIIKIL